MAARTKADKPKREKMKRVYVTLDAATIEKLDEIGIGNISMGIRIASRDYIVKK